MSDERTIESGETVYDDEGVELGVVTGATTGGVTVSIEDDVDYLEKERGVGVDGAGEQTSEPDERQHIDPESHDPGPEFGEGYLVWRCEECGEVGELDEGLPEECPNCGSDAVVKWTED